MTTLSLTLFHSNSYLFPRWYDPRGGPIDSELVQISSAMRGSAVENTTVSVIILRITQAVLSLYASGRTTSMVMDSGDGVDMCLRALGEIG
jgi:hypothetical protein